MIREISPQELNVFLNSESNEYILIDVRQPWEYNICCLPNSLNIPLSELNESRLQLLPNDKKLVTICHHGVRSRKAAILLEQFGYLNVSSLQGGIEAWALDINHEMERY